MGKKLAIQGHEKRGNDVINILKMLGGTNYNAAFGNNDETYYFIDEEGIIDYDCTLDTDNNYLVFSLEAFLEKYPFKIDDKVIDVADGCPGIIDKMKWDENVCDIKYCVAFGNGIDFGWYTNDRIKFYQPENSEDIDTTVEKTQPKRDIYASEFMITHMLLPETPYNVNDELEYKILDGYEFDRVENNKIILKVVKPEHKYPNNYDDCCQYLGYDDKISNKKLVLFSQLINARNAYWKIAGEELGLNKSWEPDWDNHNQPKFGIHNVQNNICHITLHVLKNLILVFPTEEMRDAFYENFKDLIEQCKELL